MTSDWDTDPLLRRVNNSHTVPPFWRLTIRLLHHKIGRPWSSTNPEHSLGPSPFRYHIAALPSSHSLPLGWSDKELAWLEDSQAHSVVVAQRALIDEAMTKYLRPLVSLHPSFAPLLSTREELEWAAGMVWSRAYSHTVDGDSSDSIPLRQYSLVPVLDFANHRPRPIPERQRFVVRDKKAQARFVYAPYAMAAGTEYHHDYGALTNQQLFTEYGFVPREPNPDDSVEIYLNLRHCKATEGARRMLLAMGVIQEFDQEAVGPFRFVTHSPILFRVAKTDSNTASAPMVDLPNLHHIRTPIARLVARGLSPSLVSVHRAALLRGGEEFSAAEHALRHGQPVSARNEAELRVTLTSVIERVLATLPWGEGRATRLQRLEQRRSQRGRRRRAKDERMLWMLRLVHHTRQLLERNVVMIAALTEQSMAKLQLNQEL